MGKIWIQYFYKNYFVIHDLLFKKSHQKVLKQGARFKF